MSFIIVGNGVNIQFGGIEFSNASIIKRTKNNILIESYDRYDYPQEILQWLELLHNHLGIYLKESLIGMLISALKRIPLPFK